MNKRCVVLIPVYKDLLDEDELFSVQSSLKHLNDFEVLFIGPKKLNVNYYSCEFPQVGFKLFENEFFANINGYNKLLTSESFYRCFKEYEYMLILQTDAIILKNELMKWVDFRYDYIGAPWPKGFSLPIISNKFPLKNGVLCTAFVGNGGLSLRNIDSSIRLLQEFPDLSLIWQNTGHAEDLFFAFLGTLSDFFKIPNFKVAARFSHDIDPEYLSAIIDNDYPFGVHAWSKYNREFWVNHYAWPKMK